MPVAHIRPDCLSWHIFFDFHRSRFDVTIRHGFSQNLLRPMYRSLSTAIGILLALTLSVTPVLGQQAHSVESISLPNTISANELNVAAQLYTQIETIYAKQEAKLIRSDTPAKTATLKARRAEKIEAAIKDAPLSTERYRAILNRAKEDEALQDRLQNHIQQARTDNGTMSEGEGISKLDTESSEKEQCSAGPSKSSTE